MNGEKIGAIRRWLLTTPPSERPAWFRYGVAIAVTILGWIGRESLTALVGPTSLPFIFFFPAVAVAAWLGGFRPAVLATLVSALVANWFFIAPVGALSIDNGSDIVAVLAFVAAAVVIILSMEAAHRARRGLSIELAERRRVEAELAASRDRLATTLASIGDGVIVTDETGRVSFLNAEAERLTGWPSSEAAGQRLPAVFRIVNEETRDPTENPVERVLQMGVVVGLANHTLLLARDGTEIPIDDSAAPVRRPGGPIVGAVLVFRDVREQRHAEQAQARLAAIIEFATDAIFAKDLDGVVRTWNAGAERMFGYSADEIIGRPVSVLIPPEQAAEASKILLRIRSGLSVNPFETVRLTKDGRRVPVLVSISPLNDRDGRVIGASKIIHDISDITTARQAVERERELFATTLASIGDGVIVTDAEGRVTFVNSEAERLTGWTLSDAEGRDLPSIFRIVNERNGQAVENPVEKVLRLGQVVGLANHTILIRKDGTRTPIDDSAAPIRLEGRGLHGVVLVFRDITERKRTEESLRENEKRFRQMADAAPVLIWLSGTDKLCTWFNKQWLGFVGRTMEQELGNGWAENVHAQDFDRCLETYTNSFDARQPFSMEYRLRRHDGVYRWLLDRGIPRHEPDGRFAGYIGSCVDITERRDAEQALLEADRRKDEFLAVLSHELRNPLAPIQLAVTMLRKLGPQQRELHELRDIIERQTKQMARLLDDLLDVGRITSGKVVLRRDRVSLNLVVSSAVESSRPLIESLGHDLSVRVPEVPIEVDGDLARLAQVLANLLNNAAKYTERGGRITLTLERRENEAVIRVRDTGIGLSAEQLPRVFEMFMQVKPTLERGQEGLGVGLALAKSLVELHGGRLDASSAGLGRGSEFTVRLPALAAEPTRPPKQIPEDRPLSQRSFRILVADDNLDSATTMGMMLRVAGHDVRTVHDGIAALETAEGFRPEVAILDIGMPKVNGYDVARRLRAELRDRVVLIAMTGWGQEEHKRLAHDAGFDHHLTKPIAFSAIEKVLNELGQ